MSPRLFVDLDGVLADFETHFWNRFQRDPPSKVGGPNTVDDDEMWALIHGSGDFFTTMPVFEQTIDFWYALENSGFDPIILTAASKTHFNEMAVQKMKWVRETFHEKVLVIPTYGSAHKQFYLQNPGDILIDDYAKNCNRWRDAGGQAIHHKGDFIQTLKQLIAITGTY